MWYLGTVGFQIAVNRQAKTAPHAACILQHQQQAKQVRPQQVPGRLGTLTHMCCYPDQQQCPLTPGRHSSVLCMRIEVEFTEVMQAPNTPVSVDMLVLLVLAKVRMLSRPASLSPDIERESVASQLQVQCTQASCTHPRSHRGCGNCPSYHHVLQYQTAGADHSVGC